MIERIKVFLDKHYLFYGVIKWVLIVAVIAGLAAIVDHFSTRQSTAEKPAVMIREETQDKEALRVQLDITQDKDGNTLPPEEKKVDVYKINLRKDHRIKAGASVIDGKPLMSIGYEQGRLEALAHFDGGRYQGVTVMYNVVEW